MTYIHDTDLEFFEKVKSSSLEPLVNIILFGNEKSRIKEEYRFNEELSLHEDFKKHNPDHIKYWKLIASEIQCFGGNTIANLFRGGKGVTYREVLKQVCKKHKVNFDDSISTQENEDLLMFKYMEKIFEKMSEAERLEFLKELGISDLDLSKFALLSSQVALKLFVSLVKAGGFQSYTLILQIANMIARSITGAGLKLGTNAAITFYVGRTLSSRALGILTGPVGLVVASLWTVWDLAGPAMRVMVPAVFEIIRLRRATLLMS